MKNINKSNKDEIKGKISHLVSHFWESKNVERGRRREEEEEKKKKKKKKKKKRRRRGVQRRPKV